MISDRDTSTGSRSFATAQDLPARHQVSFQGVTNDGLNNDPLETASNITMSRPLQRLRPSLSGTDGRLDVPTLEERCAVLVINARGVLSFYKDLTLDGWQDDSLDEMMRNWIPFETYKVNQLLAEGQYNHHFIDVNEVLRSLRINADRQPEGFGEAMNMANCATFVHYINQLPFDIKAYGELEDGRITPAVLADAPLRNISELNDARRIFLRWILPPDRSVSDSALSLLLDMSTQIFIHRLQRNIEMVQRGELDPDRAEAITEEEINELGSGEIVRYSLQRVKGQRQMTEAAIESLVDRYQTFANVRQSELRGFGYDDEKMRREYSFRQMASDLTNFILDIVQEVETGMRSTSLLRIMERLNRESSLESSDLPERIEASSVADGRFADQEEAMAGPSQSTPRRQAASLTKATNELEPFASQFPSWFEEVIAEDENSRLSRPSNAAMDLTESQRRQAFEEVLLEEDAPEAEVPLTTQRASSSIDPTLPSSPPNHSFLRAGEQSQQAPSSSHVTSEDDQGGERTFVGATTGLSRQITGGGVTGHGRSLHAIDSPTKQKASRLGFDSQNRLVRKPVDARKGKAFDGSGDAVRESKFDSDGEEDEDVFLENATRPVKGRNKGKQKALDPEVVVYTSPATSRRVTRAAAQKPPADAGGDGQASSSRKTRGRPEADAASASAEPQTPRRSTRRPQATEQQQEPVVPITLTTSHRATRAQATKQAQQEAELAEQISKTANADADVGQGRDGAGRQSQAALGGVDGATAEDDLPAGNQDQPQVPIYAADDMEMPLPELDASLEPEDEFAGDDDADVVARRAEIDEGLQQRPARPGVENLPRPQPTLVLKASGQTEADRRIASILQSDEVPAKRRRIGPYRPGTDYDDVVVIEEEEEVTRRRRQVPRSQSVRVEPFKRANLYITGGNMVGRQNWTEEETQCLLDSLYEVARFKRQKPRFQVYSRILELHGANGLRTQTLGRWNNVQIKDKSRNELIRMRREGIKVSHGGRVDEKTVGNLGLTRLRQQIPYWKALLHPTLWGPKPDTLRGRRRGRRSDGDESEEAVSSDEDEDEEDEIDEIEDSGDEQQQQQPAPADEAAVAPAPAPVREEAEREHSPSF